METYPFVKNKLKPLILNALSVVTDLKGRLSNIGTLSPVQRTSSKTKETG